MGKPLEGKKKRKEIGKEKPNTKEEDEYRWKEKRRERINKKQKFIAQFFMPYDRNP